MVHRSYLNENAAGVSSNERLEFLGDSVLGFVVSSRLWQMFPKVEEGLLTEMRAVLVRTETLAKTSSHLGLGSYLWMGKGEDAAGGRSRPSILEGAFEALVGAIYLDQGIRATRSFVLRCLASELQQLRQGFGWKDPKSLLQELTQSRWQLTPTYRTTLVTGPDHARVFTVEVRAGEATLSKGTGKSKQAAERQAAQEAFKVLTGLDNPGINAK
jgi:ribonuclease-3